MLGLRGISSNPTIFDNAISSSTDYVTAIKELFESGSSTFQIYDSLTINDIQDAADILKSVYDQSKGLDGYVSLEVNPQLAYNNEATLKEARRLWDKVSRANLMLKIPATSQSFPAIEELLASGINVNVTLIFSLRQYKETVQAYLKGLRRFLESGGQAGNLRSVASVFVSRLDSVVDKLLDERILKASSETKDRLEFLKGKAAIANCKLIYREYLDAFSSDEAKEFKVKGANFQRVLWASTSTKNPSYSDIKYVSGLVGKNTVNTLPETTFKAFLDHGKLNNVLTSDINQARQVIDELRELTIDVDNICEDLLKKGVSLFESSFDSLLRSIEIKKKQLCSKA